MITIDVPGYRKIEASHLVLDFNGTLAVDGKLINGVRQLLENLSKKLNIHVLTADTFGSVKGELEGIKCTLEILQPSMQDIQKEMYVTKLGSEHVVTVGNGLNDALMLKKGILNIAVIQKEGTSMKSLINANIVCFSIIDALELLIHPQRIIATLRK